MTRNPPNNPIPDFNNPPIFGARGFGSEGIWTAKPMNGSDTPVGFGVGILMPPEPHANEHETRLVADLEPGRSARIAAASPTRKN